MEITLFLILYKKDNKNGIEIDIPEYLPMTINMDNWDNLVITVRRPHSNFKNYIRSMFRK